MLGARSMEVLMDFLQNSMIFLTKSWPILLFSFLISCPKTMTIGIKSATAFISFFSCPTSLSFF
jgi:hypothetical protein